MIQLTRKRQLALLLLTMVLAIIPTVESLAAITPVYPCRFPTATATVKLNVGGYYGKIWQKAIQAWNKTGVFSFKLTAASNAQIQITGLPKGAYSTTYVGMTYIYHDNNGNISSDQTYLNTALLKAAHYTKTQDVHVAEHELGHTVGLAHNPGEKSVMYYANRYYPIEAVDSEAVRAHYAMSTAEDRILTMPSADSMTKQGIRRLTLFDSALNPLSVDHDIQFVKVSDDEPIPFM